jgi:hypothetical protein
MSSVEGLQGPETASFRHWVLDQQDIFTHSHLSRVGFRVDAHLNFYLKRWKYTMNDGQNLCRLI